MYSLLAISPVSIPATKAVAAKVPMKKVSDLFSDEENKQLSYLGSMLRREPSEEKAEHEGNGGGLA
jgi:hypothetical protein